MYMTLKRYCKIMEFGQWYLNNWTEKTIRKGCFLVNDVAVTDPEFALNVNDVVTYKKNRGKITRIVGRPKLNER